MERAGLINKIGREWIFVRVHDAVVACQRSLMQMEGGGSLGGPTITLSSMWQPLHVPAAGDSGGDPLENLPAGAGGHGVQLSARTSKDADQK
jgi:hypothetical protein